MSIKVIDLVWDRFPGSGSELITMLALADWCNDVGGSLYPSIRRVAAKVRLKEGQTRRIMHQLESEGYLEVIGNHYGGAPGSTRQYRLVVEKLKLLPVLEDRVTTAPCDTPVLQGTPVPESTPIAQDHRPLSPATETPIAHGTLSVIEPLLEPLNKNTPAKRQQSDGMVLLASVPNLHPQVAEDFLKVRKAKKAPLTATALAMIEREAAKAGITTAQAIAIATGRNWQSFKAEWVQHQKTFAEQTQDFKNEESRKAYSALNSATEEELIAWGLKK